MPLPGEPWPAFPLEHPGCHHRSQLDSQSPSAPQEHPQGQHWGQLCSEWPCWALGELCLCQGRAEQHLWSSRWSLNSLISQISWKGKVLSVSGITSFTTCLLPVLIPVPVLIFCSFALFSPLLADETDDYENYYYTEAKQDTNLQQELSEEFSWMETSLGDFNYMRGICQGWAGRQGRGKIPTLCLKHECGRSGCQPALEMPASKGWVRRIVCSVLLCISLVRILCFISRFHRMDSDHAEHFWLLLQKSTGLFVYRHCKM